MRLHELLTESEYSAKMQSDLDDLLIAAKANNITQIKVDVLVSQLTSLGYSVSSDSVMSLLNGNPLVQVATTDTVTLKGPDTAGVSGDKSSAEENRQKVAQMAKSAADKELG